MTMPILPDDVASVRATRWFTEETVPAGLLKDHTTRADTWGVIEVSDGVLLFTLAGETHRLVPGVPGIIPPAEPHSVAPEGAVRFRVVFHRRAQD